MILNLNVTKNSSLEEVYDQAGRLCEQVLEEIGNMSEFNLVSLLGFNLVSNGIVNKAMVESRENISTAREMIKVLISDHAVNLMALCNQHLDHIENGSIQKTELGG